MQNQAIKYWADEDKPREKLLRQGAKALSNTELLAILINSGTTEKSAIEVARDLLQYCHHSLPELGSRSVKHLSQIKGIGAVKAIRILAAIELGVRRNQDMVSLKKYTCTSSRQSFDYVNASIVDVKHEIVGVLYLDRNKTIVQQKIISEGGLTSALVDVRLILKYAFEYDAVALLLYHNHPSGNVTPSPQDKTLTQQIHAACQQCTIELVDHLVVAANNYFSFKDNGLL